MKILVVGGAGYIGSHMADMLVQKGHDVIVFDNLSKGYREAVLDAALIVGDLRDKAQIEAVFEKHTFDAVLDFAAFIEVGESVENPSKYYDNNVCNTLNLLDTMVKFNVKHLIFSSTAAVYGDPLYVPIDIAHPCNPINAYGRSKWMVEQILKDYDHAYGLKSICLRYFNAAGADAQARLGARYEPETHLIPLILEVANRRRDCIKIFGSDYETEDGTCVRDYIHIVDLCSAHMLALQRLKETNISVRYNLGNGQGFSVKEVIDAAKIITKRPIKTLEVGRRAGDPPFLIADATLAKTELGWQPQYPELSTIVEHAWQWELKLRGKNF